MNVDELLGLFVQYGYGIVFVAILLDNAGLPIPGELLLLLFGALARNGQLDMGGGLAVAAVAAVAGDSIGYWLGRVSGDRMLRGYCRLTLGSSTCVDRAVGFYRQHGRATVIVGRFVMGVRAFLPALAGSARMPYRWFLLFDGLGALLWSSLFLTAGYSFGWQLEWAREGYRTGSRLVLGTLVLIFAVYILVKLVRRRRHGPGTLGEQALAPAAATVGAKENPAASTVEPESSDRALPWSA